MTASAAPAAGPSPGRLAPSRPLPHGGEVLTVVAWKWRAAPGYRSSFTGEHVNVLAAMVARHYRRPHRVVCITDDAVGIDPSVGIVPLWDDHARIPSPHGAGNPSCYRRLKAFSAEARELIGERFVSLDLDCVITGDLAPVWDRPEPFVIWGDTNPTTFYNGGMFLLTAGARRQVWDEFDPVRSPARSRAMGQFGSDQGWIGACLGGGEAKWGTADGVFSYRCHIRPPRGKGALPQGARIVFFHGQHDPWGPEAQRLAWVREHWR